VRRPIHIGAPTGQSGIVFLWRLSLCRAQFRELLPSATPSPKSAAMFALPRKFLQECIKENSARPYQSYKMCHWMVRQSSTGRSDETHGIPHLAAPLTCKARIVSLLHVPGKSRKALCLCAK
jgi:hypothetical protein